MKNALEYMQAFLFSRISASGFGMMRAAWAGTALTFFLMQFPDVATFYSDAGLFPRGLADVITRDIYRFTLLDIIGTPGSVFKLYLLMLLTLTASMLGIFPRISTIASFILMCSFHERNPMILGGGDTVLRNVGFLLCIAPGIRAFSLDRLSDQWRNYRKEKTLLLPITMPAWPYLLLLWQVIVIYVTTVWFKMMGTMWMNGTAVTAALQQEVFARWPHGVMNMFIVFAPLLTYATLVFEAAWILLLIPRSLLLKLHIDIKPRLKRWLIVGGVIFHGGILVLMDVGSFSVAMFVMYLGLMLNDDFEVLRSVFNRKFYGKIHVFFDGHCGLCRRTVFALTELDHLQRLNFVDFHDTDAKQTFAPDLAFEDIDKAMHVRFPSPSTTLGTGSLTLRGYDAFRALCWHMPVTWVLAPFLYLPGISHLGRFFYRQIAERRQKCTHESCGL